MRYLSVFLLCFMLVGCAGPRFTFPSTPDNEPTKKFHHQETESIIPRVISVDGEKVYVGNEVSRTYSTGLEATKPKVGIIGRLWGALGPWLILWAILMVAGIFFPPLGFIMGRVNSALGKGTSRIVKGIERAWDKIDDSSTMTGKQFKDKMKNDLSRSYDDPTKELVSKIKNKSA